MQNPQGLEENRIVAKTGGKIAGDARRRIEQETGTPVITSQNANNLSSNRDRNDRRGYRKRR